MTGTCVFMCWINRNHKATAPYCTWDLFLYRCMKTNVKYAYITMFRSELSTSPKSIWLSAAMCASVVIGLLRWLHPYVTTQICAFLLCPPKCSLLKKTEEKACALQMFPSPFAWRCSLSGRNCVYISVLFKRMFDVELIRRGIGVRKSARKRGKVWVLQKAEDLPLVSSLYSVQ